MATWLGLERRWAEAIDPLELAVERAVMIERRALDDFQRHERTGHVPCEPHFAISPAPMGRSNS